MIDNQNEDVEKTIAKNISSKDFKFLSFDVRDYPSEEYARNMTNREKALVTIIIHIDSKRYNQLSLCEHAEFAIVENLSSRFKKMLNEELKK